MRIPIDKICVLGDFAVGKSSIARRLATGQFDESLQTTFGATVDVINWHRQDARTLETHQDASHRLVLWDIAGVDHLDALTTDYISGMSAYLLVCDATRRPTLSATVTLQKQIRDQVGDLPFCLCINKSDLQDENEISSSDIVRAGLVNWPIFFTSAVTADQLTEALNSLVEQLNERP